MFSSCLFIFRILELRTFYYNKRGFLSFLPILFCKHSWIGSIKATHTHMQFFMVWAIPNQAWVLHYHPALIPVPWAFLIKKKFEQRHLLHCLINIIQFSNFHLPKNGKKIWKCCRCSSCCLHVTNKNLESIPVQTNNSKILIEQSNLARDRHSVCCGWVGWKGERTRAWGIVTDLTTPIFNKLSLF